MVLLIDLRNVFPPLINITLWLLIPQAKPRALDPNFDISEIFVMACLSLVIAILLLFLLTTSVKLPLTLSVESLRLKAGDLSGPLTLSLLASLFLPSSLFWIVFPMILVFLTLSPWYERLLDWFRHTLQAIPALIVTCVPQSPQVEDEEILGEGNNGANV